MPLRHKHRTFSYQRRFRPESPAVVCCVISQLCTLFSYHWHCDAFRCFSLPLVPFNAKKIVKPDYDLYSLNTFLKKVCSLCVMKAFCIHTDTDSKALTSGNKLKGLLTSISELLIASHSLPQLAQVLSRVLLGCQILPFDCTTQH